MHSHGLLHNWYPSMVNFGCETFSWHLLRLPHRRKWFWQNGYILSSNFFVKLFDVFLLFTFFIFQLRCHGRRVAFLQGGRRTFKNFLFNCINWFDFLATFHARIQIRIETLLNRTLTAFLNKTTARAIKNIISIVALFTSELESVYFTNLFNRVLDTIFSRFRWLLFINLLINHRNHRPSLPNRLPSLILPIQPRKLRLLRLFFRTILIHAFHLFPLLSHVLIKGHKE
jgi:hypothetical protein